MQNHESNHEPLIGKENQEIQQPNHKRRIVEMFEVGLDAKDICGYHGTTAEAILHLAETGKLPASGSYGNELYFAQVDDKQPADEAIDHAGAYASWNAEKYYVLERLPFRPPDLVSFMYAWTADHESENTFLQELRRRGLTNDYNRLVREASRKRKGVILSLSQKIYTDFIATPGEDSYDQRKITVEGGLTIDYITGIEPMGQYEWGILERMQEEIKTDVSSND